MFEGVEASLSEKLIRERRAEAGTRAESLSPFRTAHPRPYDPVWTALRCNRPNVTGARPYPDTHPPLTGRRTP